MMCTVQYTYIINWMVDYCEVALLTFTLASIKGSTGVETCHFGQLLMNYIAYFSSPHWGELEWSNRLQVWAQMVWICVSHVKQKKINEWPLQSRCFKGNYVQGQALHYFDTTSLHSHPVSSALDLLSLASYVITYVYILCGQHRATSFLLYYLGITGLLQCIESSCSKQETSYCMLQPWSCQCILYMHMHT